MTEYNRFYWLVKNVQKGFFGGIKSFFKNHIWWAILVCLILLYSLFVGRSTYQPFVLGIRKYALLVALLIGVSWWWFRVIRSRNFKRALFPTIFMIIFLVFLQFVGPPIHKYCSLYFQYRVLNKTEISGFSETDFERIQPFKSIQTLVNQEALSETEDATPPSFIRGQDGRYYFSTAVGPSKEYKIQQLRKNMYEVIHVPANLPSPVFSKKYREPVNFDVGELLLFSKKTSHAVTRNFGLWHFFHGEPATPIYLQDEKGKWKQIVPIIRWKGWIFPRPEFDGVVVIGEVGKGDTWLGRVFFGRGNYIPAAQISRYSYLRGQNLIPGKVADYIAESFRFTKGFFAPMPGYHEGDIRIPSEENDQASQPFVTYFKTGATGKIYNYYGLEPYQEDKKALSLSVLIPGDDASKVYFIEHRNGEASFIGSSAIQAKIIESRKNYDWSENYPAESRPFIREVDGVTRFFWLSTIVTRAGDSGGEYIGGSIPEITLTDAIYGKVVWINPDSLSNSESWVRQAKGELSDFWSDEQR
jgi:hypothetical protein